MTGVGLAVACNAGSGTLPSAPVVTVAMVCSSLWAAALLHLILAYPSGRLARAGRG